MTSTSKDKKIYDYLKSKMKETLFKISNIKTGDVSSDFILSDVNDGVMVLTNSKKEIIDIKLSDLYRINISDRVVEFFEKALTEKIHGHIHMNGKFAVVEFPIDKNQTFKHGALDSQNRRLIATFETENEANAFAKSNNSNQKHHNISGFTVVPFDKEAYHEEKITGSDNLKKNAHQTMENYFQDNIKTF